MTITANSPELLIRFARAGAGITAVPDYFASPYVLRGELQRVLPEWCLPSITAWAVFPGRKLVPAKVRAFLELLEEEAKGNLLALVAVRRCARSPRPTRGEAHRPPLSQRALHP